MLLNHDEIFRAREMRRSCHTILVFDSGVGGLLVYDKIRKLLPNFNYIYAFDNVAFPYGEKSEKFILKRAVAVIAAIQRLHPLKFAVLGCNTISTVAIPAIRKEFSFPIIGIVPTIKSAIHLTTNRIIGLMATHRTIACSYTHKLIKQFSNKFHIKTLGSTKLVKLAEGKMRGQTVSLKSIDQILQIWLKMPQPPDTVILGCTHFPILRDELLNILPKGTHLVDSSTNIIRHIVYHLTKYGFTNKESKKANIAYCTAFRSETKQILPILLDQYDFKTLKKIEL